MFGDDVAVALEALDGGSVGVWLHDPDDGSLVLHPDLKAQVARLGMQVATSWNVIEWRGGDTVVREVVLALNDRTSRARV